MLCLRQCCSPGVGGGGGWGVFNSLFGWTNSATYGSVISYNLYWIVVSLGFFIMRHKEKTGRWSLDQPKATDEAPSPASGDNAAAKGGVISQEKDVIGSIA
jgi:high-affinity iron transporter